MPICDAINNHWICYIIVEKKNRYCHAVLVLQTHLIVSIENESFKKICKNILNCWKKYLEIRQRNMPRMSSRAYDTTSRKGKKKKKKKMKVKIRHYCEMCKTHIWVEYILNVRMLFLKCGIGLAKYYVMLILYACSHFRIMTVRAN